MDKVAIVILNYNGKNHLEKFLPSVVANSPGAHIYIADNASTDDSLLFLEKNHPSLSLIKIPVNYGYSKGYNVALQSVKSRYYVLLNSDIEVKRGWLEPLISLMDSNEKIGACQPKIKYFNRKNEFEYAGAAGGFIDRLAYPFCRGRIFDTIEEDKGQYNVSTEVFWASGACLVVRADLFHSIGGFDDDFFAHMEEIDLCWRLQASGYKVWYCAESTVYHLGGGTLAKSNPQKTYLNFRNNLSLIYKNYPGRYLYLVIFLRLILDGIAAIKFLFTDSIGHFWAIARAHFSIYGSLNTLRRKRANNMRNLSANPLKTVYRGLIVFDYYFSGRKKFSDLKTPNKSGLK
jgi:GT2 family glycosyltransferase